MSYNKIVQRFLNRSTTNTESAINLKDFINLNEDCIGWFAMGHHDPKNFLESLKKKGVKTRLYPGISVAQVQRSWAIIDDSPYIKETEETSEGAVPITYIELLYD